MYTYMYTNNVYICIQYVHESYRVSDYTSYYNVYIVIHELVEMIAFIIASLLSLV